MSKVLVTQALRPKFGSPSPPKMSDVAIEMCHPSAGVQHRQADPQVAGQPVRLDEETLSSEMTWRVLEDDIRLAFCIPEFEHLCIKE